MSLPSQSAAKERLSNAIEALYATFNAPPPPVIEGCPCCIEKRGVDVLLTTPLRKLTPDQLWGYVSGAFLTVGDQRDYRYLLPRIFELSADRGGVPGDIEVIIGKLKRAQWRSWPDHQQEVITEVLDAWFTSAVIAGAAYPEDDYGWIYAGEECDAILCGAAYADIPMAKWLALLEAPEASSVLKALIECGRKNLSPFWKDVPEQFAEYSEFLDGQQAKI